MYLYIEMLYIPLFILVYYYIIVNRENACKIFMFIFVDGRNVEMNFNYSFTVLIAFMSRIILKIRDNNQVFLFRKLNKM